jgi:hypothetical protein
MANCVYSDPGFDKRVRQRQRRGYAALTASCSLAPLPHSPLPVFRRHCQASHRRGAEVAEIKQRKTGFCISSPSSLCVPLCPLRLCGYFSIFHLTTPFRMWGAFISWGSLPARVSHHTCHSSAGWNPVILPTHHTDHSTQDSFPQSISASTPCLRRDRLCFQAFSLFSRSIALRTSSDCS